MKNKPFFKASKIVFVGISLYILIPKTLIDYHFVQSNSYSNVWGTWDRGTCCWSLHQLINIFNTVGLSTVRHTPIIVSP